MSSTILVGDVRAMLATLPERSVQTCVTSPPYYGLRDYGVDGQIGLEPTPDAYVAALVDVFRAVRRVLRDDGTLWLNLGDSYASAWAVSRRNVIGNGSLPDGKRANRPNRLVDVLKEKDLIGIPWRVAFALQADGWYLRADIVWSKPNPMPESVTDRPTRAHEYVFLFSKRDRYFYDVDAVREPLKPGADHDRVVGTDGYGQSSKMAAVSVQHVMTSNPLGRNRRTVWEIATQPFSGAHFAVFPEALVEPCILAGTSERGGW